MERPLISVIIPTHNDATTIETAIRSILDQTYTNTEIIVVDDGSTDATPVVIQAIAQKEPRVQYHRLPYTDPFRIDWRGVNINAGYMARNYGFTKVRGEWITFQDADDASLLNRIEVQYELAIKHNAIHLCTEWQQLREDLVGKTFAVEKCVRENGDGMIGPESLRALARATRGPLMQDWFPRFLIPFEVKWLPLTRKLFFKQLDPYPAAGNNPLFRREVIEKVKFRSLPHRVWPAISGRGTDRDFNFQVAETFGRSYVFKLPLYLWRVHGQNTLFSDYDRYIV